MRVWVLIPEGKSFPAVVGASWAECLKTWKHRMSYNDPFTTAHGVNWIKEVDAMEYVRVEWQRQVMCTIWLIK